MDTKDAVKWAAYYRLLASGSFVVGMAIAFFGVSAGLGETVQILVQELGNSGAVEEAQAAANVPLAAVSILGGVFVWQIGKSAAFFWTLNGAIDAETTAAAAEPEVRPDPAGPAGPGADAKVTGASAGEPTGPPASPDPVNGPEETTSTPAEAGTRTGTPTARDDEPARTGTAPADDESDATVKATSDAVAETSAATADDESAAGDDATNAFDDAGDDGDVDGVACGDCGYPNKESVSYCMNCGAEL